MTSDAVILADGLRSTARSGLPRLPELLGTSPAARHAREQVRRASGAQGHVLILAEPGLDAERVAREIHLRSRDPQAPLVAVDCAASDPVRLETDLLGKATPRRNGRVADLEAVSPQSWLAGARGGTLFLANVAELPASVQARLARVARDGEVRLSGSHRAVRVDVRLVGSAGPAIESDVEEGRFRRDLFRRLSAFRIDLPPLRRRAEDIPGIVRHLVEEIGAAAGLPEKNFTDAAVALLTVLPWRENIRELRQVLERVMAGVGESIIQVEDVLVHMQLGSQMVPIRPNGTLRDARRQFEREYVTAVLREYGWRISEAARALGIERTNLYRKARQLGIPFGRPTETSERGSA